MPNPNSEFLAPGARLGTWWVPADDDLNDEGGIGELPQRRDPGVLVPSTNGGWGLSLARQLHAGVSGFESLRTGRGKCDLMWGDVPGSAISLFDAIRTSHSTDYSHSYSVWHGEWYVDSPTTWVDASRKVRPVNVAFAALAAWSERQPGLGLEIDLQGQWDETRTTFTRPEPAVYLAVVGDATVRLRRELVGTISSDKLDLWLSTWFSVEDDVELGDVRHKWVVPLHDFVSFFWLRNPGVAWIRVQLAESKVLWPAEVHYAGRLARVDEEHQVQTSEQLAQFATLQGILAHGYSFQDLICGYWQWRERGYGRALELLNESQDPQLDQSLDAQLLNAVKSLESYVRTQTGTNKVNLGKGVEAASRRCRTDRHRYPRHMASTRKRSAALRELNRTAARRLRSSRTGRYHRHITQPEQVSGPVLASCRIAVAASSDIPARNGHRRRGRQQAGH